MNKFNLLLSLHLLQQILITNIINMKQVIFAALMMVSFTMAAYNTNPTNHVDKKAINTAESTVTWTGKKVTGQHTGTINIKSGNIDFEHGALVGGTFMIDMTSIANTDLDAKSAKKLEGHLKSDDFFGVASNPTAQLTITTVNKGKATGSYDITADVTIKGITKPVTFTAEVGPEMASAKIIINRAEFDVKYGSGSFFDGLGDKMIYDDFELDLKLKY